MMLKIARELIRIARLLLAFKPKGYGAWITDKGKPLYVSGPFGHIEIAAEKFFPDEDESSLDTDAAYEAAFANGWIRVIFERGAGKALDFEMTRDASRKAKEALEDLIFSGQFKMFIGDNYDTMKRIRTDDVEEALDYVKG